MNISETIINQEITAILTGGTKPVFFQWDLQIHAGKKTIKPITVMDTEKICDFLSAYTDSFSVEVMIMQGDYTQDVLPFKSNLEITLRRLPLGEQIAATEDKYAVIDSYRYRATLFDNNSPLLEGNMPNTRDKDTANRTSMINVRFALVEPVLEQLRMQTCGFILRDTNPTDAVRWLLTKYSQTKSMDNSAKVKGVTIAPNSNVETRQHIIIPHLTPLIKVPDMIHQNAGGVYASGFGFYLQKGFWYVYSPFDLKAYEHSLKTLTVINVPANRLPSPERSYRETPTQLIVLATGEAKHYDISEQLQLNQGNGVRFMDAKKAFEDWGVVEDNKLIVKRSDNVSEAVVEKRETNLNYIKESNTRFTINVAKELSDIAARSGSIIEHVWENSNPDLLYPAMPIRLMFIQNNQAREVFGILIGSHSYSTADTKGIVNKRFSTRTILRLFIERHLPED